MRNASRTHKPTPLTRGTVVGFVSLMLVALALTGCASGPLAALAPVKRTPCRVQAAEFSKALDALLLEWSDANQLASRTGRGSLSLPVGRLQETRRKLDTLEAPECARAVKTVLLNHMNATIDGYLLFMSQSSDVDVRAKFETAQRELEFFTDLLPDLKREDLTGGRHLVKYEVGSSKLMVEIVASDVNGTGEKLAAHVPWEREFIASTGQQVAIKVQPLYVPATITCAIWVDGASLKSDTKTGLDVTASCDGVVP